MAKAAFSQLSGNKASGFGPPYLLKSFMAKAALNQLSEGFASVSRVLYAFCLTFETGSESIVTSRSIT